MSSRVLQSPQEKSWSLTAAPEAKRVGCVVAVSVLAMLPALIFGVPSSRDLSNHFRFALPFYDAIASGNFYAGWLAESNAGYGDPSFRFYPPGLYYLLALFRFATGDWYVATLLTFTIVSVAGGLGIYCWARSVMPASHAMWAGLIFALAPYHLNQLYQATMLAEWAGTAILPFAFCFTERVCAHGRRRDIAGLAGCYALLVFTHVPLTVIGSFALVVYALVRMQSQRRVKTLLQLAGAAALGLCASSIYWVMMISELRWIGMNEIHRDSSVDYRFNFLLSTFSPDNLNVWWMNILALMTLLLSAPIVLLLRRTSADKRRPLRSVALWTLFTVLMTVPLSRPLWNMLVPLQETQFPWRWLALVSMGAAILTAAAMPLLVQPDNSIARVRRLLILGAMSIAVVFTLSHVVREAKLLPPHAFAGALTEVRGTSSISYWLPIGASPTARPMTVEVEAAGRAVSVQSWTPETRQFSVVAGNATEARVRTFYYPHWTAMNGEQRLNTRADNDGVLLVSLPAEAVTVDLVFEEPRRSRISSAVSLAGLIFIGVLTVPLRRKP
jgi:uncharacterized membrane protein